MVAVVALAFLLSPFAGVAGEGDDEKPPQGAIEFLPCETAQVRETLEAVNDAVDDVDLGHCEEYDETWYYVPGDDVAPVVELVGSIADDPTGALEHLCAFLSGTPAHDEICDDDSPADGAGVTGSVELLVGGSALPAVGATVTATSEDQDESGSGDALDGDYSITLAGGKTYIVCADHALAAGEVCLEGVFVPLNEYVSMDTIQLELNLDLPGDDPPGPGDSTATGLVFLDSIAGPPLPAPLARLTVQALDEDEEWEPITTGMADQEGSYALPVPGGRSYRVCADYVMGELAWSCTVTIFVGQEETYSFPDIVLRLTPAPGAQEEIMQQVPAALNCGGHTTLEAWLSQVLADADCNDWTNDQEILAGCNPFSPQETPANPQTCNGPKLEEVDPTDPDSVLRAVGSLIPPGLNCGNQQDPVGIVSQLLADADCNGWTNDQEPLAGCNPLNPWSYPGSPFPGACLDPTEYDPTDDEFDEEDVVDDVEAWLLLQSTWAQGYAFGLLHPWVLWVVLVVLGVVDEQDLPVDPDDPLPPLP